MLLPSGRESSSSDGFVSGFSVTVSDDDANICFIVARFYGGNGIIIVL